jgi:diguanylate cyclase (GGDEF)-like protein/putative nucleotidyltransferase with HDIG domain
MIQLSRWGRAYVVAVVLLGACTIIQSVLHLYFYPVGWNWLLLAFLTLVSGSATVKLPTVPATISISETFVFTSVLLFGPAAGTLTVALDALVISLWLARRGHPLYRIAFNIFALPAALWVGAHLYYLVGDVPPLHGSHDPVEITRLVLPLSVFILTYFFLNSWLIAIAISLEKRLSATSVWRENFALLSLNYFGGASVAALLVTYTRNIDYTYLAFVLPLLAVLYFTFWASMRRVEDANRHLVQLNKLYLSTIETLAMAIDAKDQITHGHIRRVQHYAVALAKKMGITDQAQISAIEAASLLHDMGKLAVPEYILNKPGRLTPAEFEKMKLHASVGADILSAIDFPYPVVPIVRHHHENWDGTGYPDGLRGGDIPIGARILSVVDCFDALTSDRPYRPRLSDNEAFQILAERRGSMYDPLVVDTFMRVSTEITLEEDGLSNVKGSLSAITTGATAVKEEEAQTGLRLHDIAASTEEMLVLYDLAQGLTANLDVPDAADLIAKHLRRVVPASTAVFYLHDADTDELAVAHAAGESAAHFAGLRIPRGQRLTGWVAANRRSILNSDPVLDLGDIARSLRPALRSCLSAPLLLGEHLVGVLTVYSTQRDGFTEDHRRILEVVGRQVSQTIQRATVFQHDRSATQRDQLTGLPNMRQLERFVAAEMTQIDASTHLSILSLKVRFSSGPGRKANVGQADDVMASVTNVIRSALRGADLLFYYGSKEFAALLLRTDSDAAAAVAARVANRFAAAKTGLQLAPDAQISIGIATAPVDGNNLDALLDAARNREHSAGDHPPGPPSVH